MFAFASYLGTINTLLNAETDGGFFSPPEMFVS